MNALGYSCKTDCSVYKQCDDVYFKKNQNKVINTINNERLMKTQLILSNEAERIMLKLNIKKIKLAIALNISRRNLDRFLNCEADCRMSTVVKIMNYLYAMEETK